MPEPPGRARYTQQVREDALAISSSRLQVYSRRFLSSRASIGHDASGLRYSACGMSNRPVFYGWWVVARWCNKRRGTALSVLGSASMTGMSLLVPLVTWLILTRGWRITYVLIAGGILALVLPLCVLVVRDSPESLELTADGGVLKA